jgi:hypothetical protein
MFIAPPIYNIAREILHVGQPQLHPIITENDDEGALGWVVGD